MEGLSDIAQQTIPMACQPSSNMYFEPFDMDFGPQPGYFPATPGVAPHIPEYVKFEEAPAHGALNDKSNFDNAAPSLTHLQPFPQQAYTQTSTTVDPSNILAYQSADPSAVFPQQPFSSTKPIPSSSPTPELQAYAADLPRPPSENSTAASMPSTAPSQSSTEPLDTAQTLRARHAANQRHSKTAKQRRDSAQSSA